MISGVFFCIYYLLQITCMYFGFFFKQSRNPILALGGLWSQGRWEGWWDVLCMGHMAAFIADSSGNGAARRELVLGGHQAWDCPRALPSCLTGSTFRPGLSDLPFPVHVQGCASAGTAAAPWPRVCVFKQTPLFPVSCQIIVFGIQGSSTLRRTKLKLELIEQNIVFPGGVRAADGRAPTALVAGRPSVILVGISTVPCCEPHRSLPCWAALGHMSMGFPPPLCVPGA